MQKAVRPTCHGRHIPCNQALLHASRCNTAIPRIAHLAHYQRADSKIPHSTSNPLGEVNNPPGENSPSFVNPFNNPFGKSPVAVGSTSAESTESPTRRDELFTETNAGTGSEGLQSIIDKIPFKRLSIWASVSFFMYGLSDFFGIAMGCFIISFLGLSFVETAQNTNLLKMMFKDPNWRRRALVLSFFLTIVAMIVLFGVMTIPDISREGADFVYRLQNDNVWVVLVDKMRKGLGDHLMDSCERLVTIATSDDVSAVFVADRNVPYWTAERSVALGTSISGMLKGYTTSAAKGVAMLLSSVTRFAVQVFVSLVLSFMLVWDFPAIAQGVGSLAKSRLSPVYNEVAPVFAVFGRLFGRALEAQTRIALVNTALTAAGMAALAIPGVGLLSLFVFICSFIPIAGCIISTVPIGFVALTEYGFLKLALVILMVTGVHFVEAYLLNPAIYSAHLKLHPLLVLSVLVVAEHSMGVWGLLLAVPSTVFALDYCIRYPESTVTEVGAQELKSVLGSKDEAEKRQN